MERKNGNDFNFPPEGKLWEVNRERLLVPLGGTRAILMQIAHPLIGQGVKDYSYFKNNPTKRLHTTLGLMREMFFGTKEEAGKAAAVVNRAHQNVKGDLKDNVGAYSAGTSYFAKDPELLAWVFATIVDTSILVRDRFIKRMDYSEKEKFYQEYKNLLPMLGGKKDVLPDSFEGFSEYVEKMMCENLHVGNQAKELASLVLMTNNPAIKFLIKPISWITKGLLPEELRKQYGFKWSSSEEARLGQLAKISRGVVPHLPARVRFSSEYLRARKKLNSQRLSLL